VISKFVKYEVMGQRSVFCMMCGVGIRIGRYLIQTCSVLHVARMCGWWIICNSDRGIFIEILLLLDRYKIGRGTWSSHFLKCCVLSGEMQQMLHFPEIFLQNLLSKWCVTILCNLLFLLSK
jgi:hypothetical protein